LFQETVESLSTRNQAADSKLEPIRAAVAIPVRNEERWLPACLEALLAQRALAGSRVPGFGVILLLNNCDDGSEAVVRSYSRRFFPALRFEVRRLAPPAAHAGAARRLAMDRAADWLDREGAGPRLILTTDADSCVGPTWIADNLAAVESGAEAVAGDIELDPSDHARLPAALHTRGALEDRYGRQLIEIGALLDPQVHNPWPHHGTISGASLAVRLSAYRRVGGLPIVPLGEDKALVRALRREDIKVRFAPEVRVVTSGRLVGRAPGGAADTIRLRCEAPESPCDAALEPLLLALARALWRGRKRCAHAAGASGAEGSFGRFWEAFEAANLPRGPLLTPADLPREIKRAESALARLRCSEPRREVESEAIKPLLARVAQER
jgi:GT2 family glycosyltransferase